MLLCWQVIPESRRLFDKLEDRIFEFLDRDISEHYVDLNEPYLLANASHLKLGKTDYLALLGSPDCLSPSIPQSLATTPDASETSANLAAFAYNPIFDITNEVTRF